MKKRKVLDQTNYSPFRINFTPSFFRRSLNRESCQIGQDRERSRIGSGFTIVELIVVIVVIGILTTIGLISYSGIIQSAVANSLKSDLSNAAGQITIYYAENGEYPIANECPTPSGVNICLQSSPGNSFDYAANNVVSPEKFSLTATNTNAQSYNLVSESIPAEVLPGKWKQISGSEYNGCAITYDDKAYCWGDNWIGELGDNSYSDSLFPVPVYTAGLLNGKAIWEIAVGMFHSCAIASDNNAYCWGEYREIGDDSGVSINVPVAVDKTGVLNGKFIKTITSGDGHTCVIASGNQAYCWGYNNSGQLGAGYTGLPSLAPVTVDNTGVLTGKTIKYIDAGSSSTCVIASDNKAYCWGNNDTLGNGSLSNSPSPVAVTMAGDLSGKTIKSISVGTYHACAIASDNFAYCWGDNSSGQLGNNSTALSLEPVAVDRTDLLNNKTIKFISAGDNQTCVVASDDSVYCWGENGYGELGNNSTSDSSVPVAVNTSGVLNGKTMKTVMSNVNCTCAQDLDGYSYCWGSNASGKFGDNSTTASLVPVSAMLP